MDKKRKIPELIQNLLAFDVLITNGFCSFADKLLPLRSLRIHYKILEISCHGIPWIAVWLAFMYLIDSPSLFQMQVNVLFGLLIDIIFVAVIKAFVRRRRPAHHTPDMFAAVGPDKFSFPSGHASRAFFVAYFFLCLWPVPIFLAMPLIAWSTSVCVSRVLLRRHHLLDVIAGILLGMFEGFVVQGLWFPQESSAWIVSWLSDERQDGGSYHV